ncbi:MAG: hypothetical protein ACP5ER_00645 [Candidatus Bathyarchaeales archaeon]
MLLFALANIGFGYVLLSKSYMDQTTPHSSELDKWTEDTAFWNSNASITPNTHDYINGSYYGNRSIEFSRCSPQVWMQLNISGSLNCSGPEGYKSLSFRLKLVEPPTNPSNVSIYLLSAQQQDNFYYDLTDKLNETGLWNNVTISLGPGWTPSSANADWGNITGLKLEFTWATDSNITLLIDGLFFHGVYKSAIESASGNLFIFPINAFMQFTIHWVTLGGLLYIVPKIFKVKTVWKPLLTIAGFALITLFIQIIVFTAVLFTWPELRFPLEVLGGVPGEWQTAYDQVFGPISTIFSYIEMGIYIWTIALCAIALRLMFAFSWMKSLFVSALSYLFSLFVFRFLTYGTIWL